MKAKQKSNREQLFLMFLSGHSKAASPPGVLSVGEIWGPGLSFPPSRPQHPSRHQDLVFFASLALTALHLHLLQAGGSLSSILSYSSLWEMLFLKQNSSCISPFLITLHCPMIGIERIKDKLFSSHGNLPWSRRCFYPCSSPHPPCPAPCTKIPV